MPRAVLVCLAVLCELSSRALNARRDARVRHRRRTRLLGRLLRFADENRESAPDGNAIARFLSTTAEAGSLPPDDPIVALRLELGGQARRLHRASSARSDDRSMGRSGALAAREIMNIQIRCAQISLTAADLLAAEIDRGPHPAGAWAAWRRNPVRARDAG